jgi:hypothetical protein
MRVVERLAQGVEQVALVPYEGAVQQFASAGLYPALHDGVHPGHPDTALDDSQSGIGQHGVEGLGELGVPVTNQEPGPAVHVVKVHDEVASELHHPCCGGVCGGAQELNAPGGVLDDREDVQAGPGQRAGLEEVAG